MVDVKTVCLGLLSDGEASGYEIKKRLEDGHFARFLDASFGSIYPALTRLTRYGHVSCRTEAQDGRPDKKIYAITDSGRAALAEELAHFPAPDKVRSEFLFFMIFNDLLAPERITAVIDHQIEQFRAHREVICEAMTPCDAQAQRPSGTRQFAAGYGLALCDAMLNYLTAHRHLVESAPDAPPAGAAQRRSNAMAY